MGALMVHPWSPEHPTSPNFWSKKKYVGGCTAGTVLRAQSAACFKASIAVPCESENISVQHTALVRMEKAKACAKIELISHRKACISWLGKQSFFGIQSSYHKKSSFFILSSSHQKQNASYDQLNFSVVYPQSLLPNTKQPLSSTLEDQSLIFMSMAVKMGIHVFIVISHSNNKVNVQTGSS